MRTVDRRPGHQLRPGPPDGEGTAPLAGQRRVAARVGRAGHQPGRAGALRLPARGVGVDPHATMTSQALPAGRRRRWPRHAAYGLAGLAVLLPTGTAGAG